MSSHPTPDAGVSEALAAGAIDRVLQAERDARAAVLACEQASSGVLEIARQQARQIFERAQAQTVALHGRAAKALEVCAIGIMERRMKTAAETVKKLSDPALLNEAVERLAARLTTEAASRDAA